uniref:Uncharacterized protein n=1 Tax=Anguilla anguilla TaxID=7936 RepID=A0A0E9QDE6_ANGAN
MYFETCNVCHLLITMQFVSWIHTDLSL